MSRTSFGSGGAERRKAGSRPELGFGGLRLRGPIGRRGAVSLEQIVILLFRVGFIARFSVSLTGIVKSFRTQRGNGGTVKEIGFLIIVHGVFAGAGRVGLDGVA